MQDDSAKRADPAAHPPAADQLINGQDANDSAGDDDEDGEKPESDRKAGRRKIKIEFIQDKSRRHITFSKGKAGPSFFTRFPTSHRRRAMLEDTQDDRLVAFFDIDNTLYSANDKIAEAMYVRIHDYFVSLGLSAEEASTLNSQYYTQYGLALLGLQRHHGVDPMEFNEKCDGSLPLEEMLKPNPLVRRLLQDIDRSKCRVWALTNAYRTHAERVLQILDLRDQIEGVVFCDYDKQDITCKPEPAFYQQAMQQAGVTDPSKCLFVDDSFGNVEGAKRVGWIRCVHFREVGHEVLHVRRTAKVQEKPFSGDDMPVITDLQQLREVWPDIFV